MERRDEAVNGYRTIRTTTGHRIRVRMSADERDARFLYWFSLVTITFAGAAGMFLLWVKAV